MKNIALGGIKGEGKFTLVDDEDFKRLNKHKWNIRSDKKGQEYIRTRFRGEDLYLHRHLLNAPKGVDVDHVDGNRLNNQKSNLRLCTRQQNSFNSKKRKQLSGYRGAYFIPGRMKHPWVARYGYNYKTFNIGYFSTAIEAAKAYDMKVKELYGEFANLNFSNKSKNMMVKILSDRQIFTNLSLHKGELYEVEDIVQDCYKIKIPMVQRGVFKYALVNESEGDLVD